MITHSGNYFFVPPSRDSYVLNIVGRLLAIRLGSHSPGVIPSACERTLDTPPVYYRHKNICLNEECQVFSTEVMQCCTKYRSFTVAERASVSWMGSVESWCDENACIHSSIAILDYCGDEECRHVFLKWSMGVAGTSWVYLYRYDESYMADHPRQSSFYIYK